MGGLSALAGMEAVAVALAVAVVCVAEAEDEAEVAEAAEAAGGVGGGMVSAEHVPATRRSQHPINPVAGLRAYRESFGLRQWTQASFLPPGRHSKHF